MHGQQLTTEIFPVAESGHSGQDRIRFTPSEAEPVAKEQDGQQQHTVSSTHTTQ